MLLPVQVDNLQDEDRGFMTALQHLVFTSKACCLPCTRCTRWNLSSSHRRLVPHTCVSSQCSSAIAVRCQKHLRR